MGINDLGGSTSGEGGIYGILGFTKSCALEGAKKGVFSNVIAPIAASRMTETVMPKDMLDTLKPEAVVPLAVWMCHESSGYNAEVIEAGGGWFSKLRIERTKGAYIPGDFSAEDVQAKWEAIQDFKDSSHPKAIQESVMAMVQAAQAHQAKSKL